VRQRAEQLAPGLDWEKPQLEDLMGSSVNAMMGVRPPVDPKRSRNSGGAGSGSANTIKEGTDTWISRHPTNYYGLVQRAKSLVEEKQFESAKEPLQRLVDLYPTQTGPDSAYAMLAAADRGLGDTNAERQVLTKFVQQDDAANEAYLRLAELSAAASDWPAVVQNAERSLAVDPLVSAPYRFLAQASRHSGDNHQAILANRALLQLDPPNPAQVHFELAKALHSVGDPGATRQVLQALEEAPRYRQALELLVQIHGPPVPNKPEAPPSSEAKP
jgi:tetratricopeptide (TPR) repeat protein